GGTMGKRTTSLLVFLAMLLSVFATTPAVAQPADDSPDPDASFAELSAADEFEKILLTRDVPEPMALDIADDGRVFVISRDGGVRVYHPDTGEVTVAAELRAFDDHALPPNPEFEGSKNHGVGLRGIAVDPDGESTG